MTTVQPAVPAPGRLRTYASFVRFEHTLFSLPLILAGAFSAIGPPLSAARWALVAVAAVGARTAAMTLNRIIDRHLDAQNPRTRARELPAGTMGLGEAVAMLVVSTVVYLAACASLGTWYLVNSFWPIAVFVLYPYLKRVTPLCHFGVGAALAMAPLAGYAAAHPDLKWPGPAFLLAAFAFCWVSGFDIIYATLDEAFDREHGVHSMVVWLGRRNALRVSWALHLAAIACMAVLTRQMTSLQFLDQEMFFPLFQRPPDPLWVGAAWLGFAATALLLWLEQRWAEDVNLAFFKTNVVVGFVVLATVLAARMATGGFAWLGS